MKFTLSWLKDHLETEATLDEIVERLPMLGLEVEGVEDRAAGLEDFTVGYVVEARQHPNADRLTLCLVDDGAETVQVVCGAPNARTGMKGVFAPAGSHIPGTGLDLKKGVIRGEESNGMLCSEREMGLSDEHEGIIELPDDAPIGAPFAEIMGFDDPVIDVAITPNRGDCLGVRGIARDLAAAGLGSLKPLDIPEVAGDFAPPVNWRRDLPADRGDACPRVVGRYYRGVTNGPSPAWMQARLTAIGLRPISALVDITNYVTHDLGRPLHVFDADKLDGDLTMRFARDGETILALDGKDYTLDPDTVVIADNARVNGIGGIMGGEETGCTGTTTNMFLEVALFDPVTVAAAGRRLGIQSDARYRFERGVDPTSAIWGAHVATRLVREICGGEVSTLSVAGDEPDWRKHVALRHSRILGLTGADVPEPEAKRILETLGFEVAGAGEAMTVAVPPWRPDIDGEADLVEEVVRVAGYDAIPVTAMRRETSLPRPALDMGQRRAALVRRVLAGRGMMEAVTYSFMPSGLAAAFGDVPAAIVLDNPISSDLDAMRPSILPNLLDAARRNADRGYPDVALFEVGPQYADDTPDGQAAVAAGLRAGRTGPRHWQQAPREADAFDAKADALAALAAIGAPVGNLQVSTDAPDWYHPGLSGTLRLGPNVLAWFGALNPKVLRRADADGPVAAFEIFLDRVPAPRGAKAGDGKARPRLDLSPYQAVSRDFAFVVATDVTAEAVLRAARGADKDLIDHVDVFDVYTGEGVEEGQRSLAISVTLQPTAGTLTDAEIDAVGAKVVAAVAKHTGGVLRG